MVAQKLHDVLQVVFATALDTYLLALNLRLDSRHFIADELGNRFGLLLVESGLERYLLGQLHTTRHWFFGQVEYLAALAACHQCAADDIEYTFAVHVVGGRYDETGFVAEPIDRSRCAPKIIAIGDLTLYLLEDVVDLRFVVVRDDIK